MTSPAHGDRKEHVRGWWHRADGDLGAATAILTYEVGLKQVVS